MNCDEALKVARVESDGTILIGNSVVCDGYSEGRSTAVFTHIHSDHTSNFETALGRCDNIFVSKPTYDMLVALKGEALTFRYNFSAIDFGDSFFNKYGEKVTLYLTNHILGSAQVLVQRDSGDRILYSGDFNFPDAQIVKCNILILDSTHGDPMFDNVYNRESLPSRLVDIVTEQVCAGKPVMIRAHRGTIQEIMSFLDRNIIGAVRFLADEKDLKLSQVYGKYGHPCKREIIKTNKNPLANRIIEGGMPYVHFRTIAGAMSPEEEAGMCTVRLSSDKRVLGGYAIREVRPNFFSLDYSDHASFDNILKYVRETEAKVVITDNARTKFGLSLAEAIRKGLGIEACTSPPE